MTTAHFEYYNDSLDIMIYGIDVKEIFPVNYDVIPDSNTIQLKIMDIMEKCESTNYEKKAIML